MSAAPKTVSLILGSGGARGLAHIGVIQWLIENDYEIRSISGSSMGALIGGIYATDKLQLYTEWVLALERVHVLRLLDPAIGRPGLFKGERIIAVLRQLIGDHEIESLPIAFTAVATDLDSGREVWLRRGDLFAAIRASIATPLVFTPVRYGGRTLLDGAVVNPLPVATALADETDLKVAVDLSGPLESPSAPLLTPPATPSLITDNSYRQRILKFVGAGRAAPAPPAPAPREASRGLLDVAFTSMQIMQDTIANLKSAAYSADVKVSVPRDACGFFEFWRAEELIALGRDRAERAFAQAGLGPPGR